MPLASQIELPERYRVERHIASGGMASVWEAEDLLLGRTVAVKVLGAQYAADPDARARFQREARTAAQVSDQTNVVTIYDIGEHRDDAFIVMEYFAGGTVADRLRAARKDGEQVSHDTALRWLGEAAAGLDVAHAAGIVHRDVKPANLLLDAQGRLAVADFGIARLADDTQMTQTGQVLGTAAYISPEQALGQPATPASDRYALAVVAYELLTGSRPFSGGPPTAQALQHARDKPPRASQAAPELPEAVDAVFARGLAKDPAQRPATASELVAALQRALDLDDEPGGVLPIDPTKPTQRMPDATARRCRSSRPRRALSPRRAAVPPTAEQPAATPPRPAAAKAEAAQPRPARGADDEKPSGGAAAPAGKSSGAPPAAPARAQPRRRAPQAPGPAPQRPPPPSARTPRRDAAAASERASASPHAGAPAPPRPASAAPAATTRRAPSPDAVSGRAGSPPPLLPPGRLAREPTRGPRGLPPWVTLGGAAVLVIAVIALVVVLAGGDDPQQGSKPSASKQAERKSTRTATTPAASGDSSETSQTPAQSSGGTGGKSAAALNAEGKALSDRGQYAAAVEPLRASVAAYRGAGDKSLNYAFALYNLGVALNRSGNPGEAVPLLRERLGFDNQTATVQEELDSALAKLNGDTPANGKAKKDKPDKGDRLIGGVGPIAQAWLSQSAQPPLIRSSRSTRQGLPTASTPAGTSRVTTLPAPTTARSPTLTPGHTITPPPSHAPSPIAIGRALSQPELRSAASSGCVAVNSWTLVAIWTSSPIVTGATSRITVP